MLHDLRYAWRQLRRTPGFTGVAVLTLALGIGANTMFVTLVDAAVWRPLRAIQLDDTYDVYVTRPMKPRVPGQKTTIGGTWLVLTMPHLEHLRSLPELGVVAVAGVRSQYVTARTAFDAERVTMEVTRGEYAGVTRMRPLAGELAGLRNDGSQAGPVVVISERLWREWFRADRGTPGRDSIRLNGSSFTVAGVAPASHSFRGTDIWVAAESWRRAEPTTPDTFASAQVRFRAGSEPARLRPMIDLALANGPSPPTGEYKTQLAPVIPEMVASSMRRMTWPIVGLSVLVLLAACANLANMLAARAEHRTGEIGVRLSLGASTGQVFRLFLFEATIIAGLASAAGLAMAWTGVRYVGQLVRGAGIERLTAIRFDLSPDWRIVAYVAGAAAFATVMVGGVTAWRGSRTPPLRLFSASGIAQSTGLRRSWTRTALVAVQVSAAVILLLGTGLYLIQALTKAPASLAFDTRRLATAQIDFHDDRFNASEVPGYLQRILTSVERLEGIEAGAITNGMFGAAYSRARDLRNLVAEDDLEPGRVSRRRLVTGLQAAVSPRFLDVLGLKVTSGRNVRPNDGDGAPEVVLLSDSAARRLWPDLDPLGRRVRLAGDPRWFTVVGTFEDPMRQGTDGAATCSACVALTSSAQMTGREWLVVLRSAAPGVAIQQVRPAVDAINADVPVFRATIADRSIFATTNIVTAFSGLVGSLGLVSLLIAGLGVYGVISYSVSRRTREFGIRLALGATPGGIVRAVIDDAVHLVLVGLLPGVLLASWATRAFESRIVNLMPNDIPTWFAVPVLILVIGMFAAWIPARRAGRADPNVALRDL